MNDKRRKSMFNVNSDLELRILKTQQNGKVACLNTGDMFFEAKAAAYSKPIKLLLFTLITKASRPQLR